MIRASARAILIALATAAATTVCLFVAYSARSTLVIEMDRPLARKVAAGIYPPERAGELTFAWTGSRADITLAGITRRNPWSCTLRVRGARGDAAMLPRVDVAVDGITAISTASSNEFQDLDIHIPARPGRDGLTLSIGSSMTVVPGPSDPRQLGIQVDRLACRAVDARFPAPPSTTIRAAAVAGGVFGFAAAVAGVPLAVASGAALLFALGDAWLIATGTAPYEGFAATMLPFVAWIAVLMLGFVHGARLLRGRPLSAGASAVVLLSAVVLSLKIGGVLHPSKLLIDVVFHAHRFEAVLAGNYYFTQGMPGGVSFPYAIALYVVASPWASLTDDHVMLLRVVVAAAETLAGALLFPMIARVWRNAAAGVIAVALFHVVPLPYELIGNANMTNAFGTSAALIALVAATVWPLALRRFGRIAALFALFALAFLSHVSTFSLLVVTLVAAAVFWWWGSDDRDRTASGLVLGVGVAAALFAVVVYYGHFMEVYKTAWRARTAAAVTAPATPGSAPASLAPNKTAVLPITTRAKNALTLTEGAIGWPILVLAAIGAWRMRVERRRDRVAGLVAAWLVAYVAFLGVALMRVDVPFQRYAAEFVGRVVFATYPAAVVLAAVGLTWAWRSGTATRVVSLVVAAAALGLGIESWAAWF